jgi:transcriptional regulator with XRE-family HTH domain
MKFEEYKNKLLKEDKEFAKAYFDKENDFAFDVANLITEARLHAGLTQDALAKKIGTTQPAIARIERGSALPSLSFLQKIAKALGTYLIAPKFGFMEGERITEEAVNMISATKDVPTVPEKIILSPYVSKNGVLTNTHRSETRSTSFINKT